MTTCLQILRVYAKSVPCLHGHNGLDAIQLVDSEINNRLIKQYPLIDKTYFKLISQLFCCLLFLP